MDTNSDNNVAKKEPLMTDWLAPTNRPEEADENIIKAAVEELLPEIMDYLDESGDSDESDSVAENVFDVVKSSSYKNFDAFHIARELEDHHHWDCDEEAVNLFSKLSSIIYRICRDAQRKWVSGNNIVPKFIVGAKVNYRKYNSKYSLKDQSVGFITAIHPVDGEYVINDAYKTTYGGKIIRFENVIGLVPLSDEERKNLPQNVLHANGLDATPAQPQV